MDPPTADRSRSSLVFVDASLGSQAGRSSEPASPADPRKADQGRDGDSGDKAKNQ